jgi:hypothetical protein
MKKIYTILLALCAFGIIVAGCKPAETETKEGEGAAPKTTETAPETGK